MTGARRVTVYVHAHVRDADGNIVDTVVLKPGDEVPDGVELGDQCFAAGDEAEAEAGDYSKLKVDELKAEIDRRNEGRGEDSQIVPDGDKKADLVAALEADDSE